MNERIFNNKPYKHVNAYNVNNKHVKPRSEVWWDNCDLNELCTQNSDGGLTHLSHGRRRSVVLAYTVDYTRGLELLVNSMHKCHN